MAVYFVRAAPANANKSCSGLGIWFFWNYPVNFHWLV